MHNSLEELLKSAMRDYESVLYRFACNILRDRELSQEVVQDVFIRLAKQPLGSVNKNLKAWLFRVCRNRCYDMLRKNKNRKFVDSEILDSVASGEDDPAQRELRKERYAATLAYLDCLNEEQREVILLKFQNGLSYKEIEEVTGLSSSKIGYLIHSGVKKIQSTTEEG